MSPDSNNLETLLERYFEDHSEFDQLDEQWISNAAADNKLLDIELRVAIKETLYGAQMLKVLTDPEITTLHLTSPRFDRLELIEPVGGGGFGYVYRARQLSLDRDVAVKFFSKRAIARKSFEQEKTLLKALGEAERIPDVHDAGEVDGYWYIAMDFVEGPTLREWLLRHDDVSERTCRIILDGVLEALQQAHETFWDRSSESPASPDLIHGDVKPDNIILRNGDPSKVRLLDFGVARLFGEVALGHTPAYASPEMLTPTLGSDKRQITALSDMFQVGLIGFELATRTRYWNLSTSEQLKHLHGTSYSAHLRRCIEKAVAWNPIQRHVSIHAFRRKLNTPRYLQKFDLLFGNRKAIATMLFLGSIAIIVLGFATAVLNDKVSDLNQDLSIARKSGLEIQSEYDKARNLYEACFSTDTLSCTDRAARLNKAQKYLGLYLEDFGKKALNPDSVQSALDWLQKAKTGMQLHIRPLSFEEQKWINPELSYKVLHNSVIIGELKPTVIDESFDLQKELVIPVSWKPYDVLKVQLFEGDREVNDRVAEKTVWPESLTGQQHLEVVNEYKFTFECTIVRPTLPP